MSLPVTPADARSIIGPIEASGTPPVDHKADGKGNKKKVIGAMSNPAQTRQERPLGWTGWAFFAAAILFINGMFSLTQGLILLVGPDTYTSTLDGELFIFDVTGWAWWNIAIGILLLATGGSLFSGATWARIVAVFMAILSAVSQLFVVPVQPFWSLIVIAIDVFIIYALLIHGDDIDAES